MDSEAILFQLQGTSGYKVRISGTGLEVDGNLFVGGQDFNSIISALSRQVGALNDTVVAQAAMIAALQAE